MVKTYDGLIAMKVFVGTFEAGLILGTIFLPSAYYPRFELQWMLGVLMCSTALASAFGGLLAYANAGMAIWVGDGFSSPRGSSARSLACSASSLCPSDRTRHRSSTPRSVNC